MKKASKLLVLGILFVTGALSLQCCSDDLTAPDLVGTYSLTKYVYGRPDGTEAVFGPPIYFGTLAFASDGTYSLNLSMAGTKFSESGSYVVELSSGRVTPRVWLKLHPSTGGESIGSCSDDAREVYLASPVSGKPGGLTLVRQKA